MRFYTLILYITLMSITVSSEAQHSITAISPDKNIELIFNLSANGVPGYQVNYKGKPAILPSTMGFKIKEAYGNDLPSMTDHFSITATDSTVVDETWNPVWGEEKTIRNNYRQLKISIQQTDKAARKLNIIFRLFNDGVAFRFEFPAQENLSAFIIADELTQFHLNGEHKAFWIPGDYDSNEFQPVTSSLQAIDASVGKLATEIAAKQNINSNTVQSPLMLKRADKLYINIHEAALVNYAAMNLELNKSTNTFTTHLVPDAFGYKVHVNAPAVSPWRTIIISDDARQILSSRMILNLNEPAKIGNTSWIKPMKFVGVWWEMHVGVASWDKASGKHGATTANVKRYIDFAAKNNIDAVLVEGWNTGWEDWFGKWKEDVFDFITPYPDFDVKEIQRYAASKKIKMIMHHETSAAVTSYERQLDTAFRFMKDHGYNAVKTGYVGKIIPRGEYHDGQWMVNHYIRVAEKAAEYKIMVDAHEPVRPTGLHRTYPNWMACEASRGNEFNAWSEGNKPEHETILPFTRLMGGPMDYTPGIFEIKMSAYDTSKKQQVHTTLAKQLALYVTMYSPLQMAADLPQNYEKHMDAFQFIKNVAVDWDETKVLEAEPGDYVTIARKAKGSSSWFIGAITDEHTRSTNLSLDFLSKGKKYTATIYEDAADADWQKNPIAFKIRKLEVNNGSVINLVLAAGGGAAIELKEK